MFGTSGDKKPINNVVPKLYQLTNAQGQPVTFRPSSGSTIIGAKPVAIIPRSMLQASSSSSSAPGPAGPSPGQAQLIVPKSMGRDTAESPPELFVEKNLEPQEQQQKVVKIDPEILEARQKKEFIRDLERKIVEERQQFDEERSGNRSGSLKISIGEHVIEEFVPENLEHILKEEAERKRHENPGPSSSSLAHPYLPPTNSRRKSQKSPEDVEKEEHVESRIKTLLLQASKHIEKDEKEWRDQRKRSSAFYKNQEPEEPLTPPRKRGRHLRKSARKSVETKAKPEKPEAQKVPEKSPKRAEKRAKISEVDKLLAMDFGPKEGGTLKDLEAAKPMSFAPRKAALPENRLMLSPQKEMMTTTPALRRGRSSSSGLGKMKRPGSSADSEKTDSREVTKTPEVAKTIEEVAPQPREAPEIHRAPSPAPQIQIQIQKTPPASAPNPEATRVPTTPVLVRILAPPPLPQVQQARAPIQVQAPIQAAPAPQVQIVPPTQGRWIIPGEMYLPAGGDLNYRAWSVAQMFEWVTEITGSAATAQIFRDEEMDGTLVDYLTQDDLRNQLKLPFGPMMKLLEPAIKKPESFIIISNPLPCKIFPNFSMYLLIFASFSKGCYRRFSRNEDVD
ncbi:unnamed protein product [Caenorhabditis angaria]|uniref:SAM domain-containing protein n=1 Tax=Caenorhabditis angaria TaxID=860376 RepID=A0A9P1I9N5_9PELO|nr:unnamed protein product [Caenorhabditis angaria]